MSDPTESELLSGPDCERDVWDGGGLNREDDTDDYNADADEDFWESLDHFMGEND